MGDVRIRAQRGRGRLDPEVHIMHNFSPRESLEVHSSKLDTGAKRIRLKRGLPGCHIKKHHSDATGEETGEEVTLS